MERTIVTLVVSVGIAAFLGVDVTASEAGALDRDTNAFAKLARVVALPCGDSSISCFAVLGKAGHHVWIMRATFGAKNGPVVELTDYIGKRPDLYSPRPGAHRALLPTDEFPNRPVGAIVRSSGEDHELIILEQSAYAPSPNAPVGGRLWGFSCYSWDASDAVVKPRLCVEENLDELFASLRRDRVVPDKCVPASTREESIQSWTHEIDLSFSSAERPETLARAFLFPPPEILAKYNLGRYLTTTPLEAGWSASISPSRGFLDDDDAAVLIALANEDGRATKPRTVGFLYNRE